VPKLARDLKATGVFWNRRFQSEERAVDAAIKASLRADGCHVASFNGALLRDPWEIVTQAGTPVKVFTPFWRAHRALGPMPGPVPVPVLVGATGVSTGSRLTDWGLEPARPNWASGFDGVWSPGEAGALARLEAFLTDGMKGYAEDRNRPDLASTSRLSPHLRFGEISPRQIWAATQHRLDAGAVPGKDAEKFLAEVGWREFSYHLLHHWPDLPQVNFNRRFDAFPWRDDEALLTAWQRGRTGYPIVDAGMRELWTTGWMHNRVRMIVASFLIKHLMIDWRHGEAWFWDTLVDADHANNAASWQWVAGSGADAAPYFRIFNPMTQGESFDPNGDYVRRWVPELARLPAPAIHAPWTAPPALLSQAGVTLGVTTPHPIVDHGRARARALDAFETLKNAEAA
jgi:deoxyribodipyrimidine photo-lyase